nr:retrovirus-related Pol polyprotein from transposon TNT 1-94 [Tanacetum cinerariifolium]
MISIPNEDLSDDTTPSVARKFLNEDAYESLDKQKSLELKFERLLKASVSHDIMSIMQNGFVDVPSDLQTELDQSKYDKISYDKAYNDKQQKVERLQAQLRDLNGKSSDTPSASNTLDPLNQKLESKIVELEFQVVSYECEISHLKTTYKNLFDSITSNPTHAKLHNLIHENAKLRAWLFENTSESMNNTSGTSVTPHVDKPKLIVVTPHSKKSHASILSHSVPQPREFNVMKHRNVITPGMFKIDQSQTFRFLGTVHFGNDHIAAILGYGDLKWRNITITRIYFVEGIGHNLFLIGQFCDADLEVTFRRNTCFIRDLDGVDLLKGNYFTNLYTINLYDIASASPICLMARATPTKSLLRHQRLSHLNFDTINDLAKNDLVSGLPKFKYAKEHLCPSCEQGKSKRASHPPKLVLNSKERLYLLHMDLCGPMQVTSINGKRSNSDFLKKIYVRLQAPVIIVRTDNETEFKNHALKEYFDSVGITHETSAAKTPQQNGVVERRNRMLVEATRTMLIFFSCSVVPVNDHEVIDKLGAKGDIGFFIGYSANSVAYRGYNRRTKKIMKTMNVTFDELSAMAFEQNSSRPGLQSLTSGQISSELELTYAPTTITPQRPSNRRDLPKDTPIDRLEVLRYDIGKRSKVRMKRMPTETEFTLEQTQQEHQIDIFVIFTWTMEILLEPTSSKLLVGDVGDSIWIELVTLDINLGPE